MAKTPLKSRINRFFYRNRDKGIPNLMLFVAIGNAVVYLSYLLNKSNPLFYNVLCFDPELILNGQIWRLFSFPLTYLMEYSPFLGLISLLFYYWAGRVLEEYWGTLKFNCYYLCGLLLTDAAALLINVRAQAGFLNLSLFLALATLMPEEQIRIFFLLPIKMKWLALFDLVITLISVITGIVIMIHNLQAGEAAYLDWILSLVPLVNYFLFFGRQSAVLIPDFIRFHPTRKSWQRQVKQKVVYPGVEKRDQARFRCTVCGRTELSNPGLEFRYCSKCAGYRCYCIDHINNHTHITQ